MRLAGVWLRALLVAAPLFSQVAVWTDPQVAEGEPKWFLLTESEAEVRARLGQPAMVADFGAYRSWQYQIGGELDHDDFSHALVFRREDGKLVSVAHTYGVERDVDSFFPPDKTTVHTWKSEFSVRVRRLSGGRLLLAMGTSKAGQRTGQLLLIRESEVKAFYPWIRLEQ